MRVKRFEDSWRAVVALERNLSGNRWCAGAALVTPYNFDGNQKQRGFKAATSSHAEYSLGIGAFSDTTDEILRYGTT